MSVCLYVSVSVTTLVSTMNALKPKVRYQQKALDAGNKINVGIELKIILGLKTVTVISIPWNLHLVLTEGNRHQQVASVVRRTSSSASTSVSYTN